MDRKTKFRNRTDALVMLIATIGVAVLLNAVFAKTSLRADLTRNKMHTLSEASIEAARALEGVTIVAYISKRMPEVVPTPQGDVPLKGIDRAFRDKLEEYLNASNGGIRLIYADTDTPNGGTIEEQAEAAKLEPFSSTDAKVADGRLKFEKYALGCTIHYKSVSEVLPKAIQPGFFEFEISKRLLRLKEKYDNSKLMADLLDSGKKIQEAAKACNQKVQDASKVEEGEQQAGLSLQGEQDPSQKMLAALQANKKTIEEACMPVGSLVESEGAKLNGRNEFVDNLVASASQFAKVYGELIRYMDGGGEQGGVPANVAVAQLTTILGQLYAEVDSRHTTLTDSPGQRKIGFLCGHHEFCPFRDPSPLVQPQMQMMLQNNQMMQQIVQTAEQIAQSIDQTNERIGDGLFVKRGFSIKQVDSDTPFPDDIAALIIYAPRKPLTEYDRYQVDQFLLGGRPVVILAQQYEVALQNMSPPSELGQDVKLDHTALSRTESDMGTFLSAYGVELSDELVLDSKRVETVRVTQFVNRGGLRFQTQQDFPYALIPVAVDFDRSHALTRSIQSLALPYTTTVEPSKELAANDKFEISRLVQSSDSSLKKNKDIPLLPPALKTLVLGEQATGPHTLALSVRGPFTSAFKGKPVPQEPKSNKPKNPNDPFAKPDKTDDQRAADYELAKRRFKETGEGKLLVVASNLGIEGLSRASVLTDFNAAQLTKFSVEALESYQRWQANFQNWQIRIGQVSHLLPDNLRFLFNVLDWANSHEALVDIRSKGDSRTPMEQLDDGEAQKLRLSAIVGVPLLLVLFGFGRFELRRRRAAGMKV